ncbi:hypothetical protein BDW22DRAFT_1362119 [Trametopsis cervina]|nr:hypothetical protein BDW22DRAFT_1362119 [Trametopsis cervina]
MYCTANRCTVVGLSFSIHQVRSLASRRMNDNTSVAWKTRRRIIGLTVNVNKGRGPLISGRGCKRRDDSVRACSWSIWRRLVAAIEVSRSLRRC